MRDSISSSPPPQHQSQPERFSCIQSIRSRISVIRLKRVSSFDLSVALVDGSGAVCDIDLPFHFVGLLFGVKIASCHDGDIGDFVVGCHTMPAAVIFLFHKRVSYASGCGVSWSSLPSSMTFMA